MVKEKTVKIQSVKKHILLCWSNFLMMVSRKVFCGATCPLRTGILAPGRGATLQEFQDTPERCCLSSPPPAAERTTLTALSAWRRNTDGLGGR